jgi:GNAT superfamily N-acetyltransferase
LIERVTSADEQTLDGLARLLCESVESGDSVGFLRGLQRDTAADWWRALLADESVLTWVAREGTDVVGTCSLRLATPENGRHRAEVSKLLVRQDMRRKGVGTALMATVEEEAPRRGRSLLILDTDAGSTAELFYESLGWQAYGLLPDHAADPDGQLRPTRFYRKPV